MAGNPLAPWRDASLILLALQAFILGLLPLGVLYLANQGVRRFLAYAKPAFAVLRGKVYAAEEAVRTAMHKVVWPFVEWQSMAAGVQQAWRRLRSSKNRPSAAFLASSNPIRETEE